MIINIRGTSGSGKSTIAKKVMSLYRGPHIRYFEEGRRQPIGYACHRENSGKPLAVIGHYEIACGGTDTISGYEKIFALIRKAHESGMDVLYEGLLLSGDVKWAAKLHEDGLPLLVIGLNVPIEVCLDAVNTRRHAKKPDALPVNPANTMAKHRSTKLGLDRLSSMGVRTAWCTRTEAFNLIQKELRCM